MIYLVVAVVLTVVALLIGYALGKAQRDPVDKSERRELDALRDFMDELTAKAAEHATLGDDFALITLGDIRHHNQQVKALRR